MKINYLNKDDIHPQLKPYNPLVQKIIGPLLDETSDLSEIINTPHQVCQDVVLRQAIRFILDIKENQYKTMIVGDYDCDGICSTALLVRLFHKLGIEPGYYIPNRIEEGYGLSVDLVNQAHQKDYQVLITVDNGVAAHEALAKAKSYGMKIMIIDHHQIAGEVFCDVLYHCELLSSWFQNQCASGLVATLMDAMELMDEYDVSLAAIGTVGDIMLLTQHNRFLVQEGIKKLNQHRFKTIDKLSERKITKYDETVLSFNIVPVLNAIGRLNHPSVKIYQMVTYLIDPWRAGLETAASQIRNINKQRKRLTKNHIQLANQQIKASAPVQVIFNSEFHEGIIGIVSGSIANKLQVPVLVGTNNGDLYKFSVRSRYLDIYAILSKYATSHFENFGGHALACAFAIRETKFESFKTALELEFEHLEIEEPTMDVIALSKSDLKYSYFETLERFAPFGQGFYKYPIMIDLDLGTSNTINTIGRKWQVNEAHDLSEVVTFSSLKDKLIENQNVLVVGQLQKGYYRNRLSLLAEKFIL